MKVSVVLFRVFVVLLALSPALALAQDAGGEFLLDASVPDASVGEGGADRDQQEAEDQTGRVPTVCRESDDCAAGFSCQGTRCVYTGVRRATGGGCLGAAPAVIILFGAGLAVRRRRA